MQYGKNFLFLSAEKAYGKNATLCKTLLPGFVWEKTTRPDLRLYQYLSEQGATLLGQVQTNPVVAAKKKIGTQYGNLRLEPGLELKGFVERGSKYLYNSAAGVKVFYDGDYYPGDTSEYEIVNESNDNAPEAPVQQQVLDQALGITSLDEFFLESDLDRIGGFTLESMLCVKDPVSFVRNFLREPFSDEKFREDLLVQGPCLAFPKDLLWDAFKKGGFSSAHSQNTVFGLEFPEFITQLGPFLPQEVLLGLQPPDSYPKPSIEWYRKVRDNPSEETVPKFRLPAQSQEVSAVAHLAGVFSPEAIPTELANYTTETLTTALEGLEDPSLVKEIQALFGYTAPIYGYLGLDLTDFTIPVGVKTAEGEVKRELFLTQAFPVLEDEIVALLFEKPKTDVVFECLVNPSCVVLDQRLLGIPSILVQPSRKRPLVLSKSFGGDTVVFKVYIE